MRRNGTKYFKSVFLVREQCEWLTAHAGDSGSLKPLLCLIVANAVKNSTTSHIYDSVKCEHRYNSWKPQVHISKILIANIMMIFLYHYSDIFSHCRAQLAKPFHLEDQKQKTMVGHSSNKCLLYCIVLHFICVTHMKHSHTCIGLSNLCNFLDRAKGGKHCCIILSCPVLYRIVSPRLVSYYIIPALCHLYYCAQIYENN